MTRSDMVEDGSVEESPSEAGELAAGRCSEDEPDDAELVHSAAGRCSDDEPLSALKPEGAEQPQGERPQDERGDSQLHESQGHEVSQVDPEASQQLELEDELEAMLEGTTQLDGDESQGHEESQLDTEPSMPNETFRAQYTRLSQREPEPRCL